MKLDSLPPRTLLSGIGHALLAAGLLCCQLAGAGQTKTIRLRNETITTESWTKVGGTAQGYDQATQGPTTGLFLVQLEGALVSGWQSELRSLGVELLKYVPDDAFI